MTLEILGADVSLLVPLPIDLLKRYVNLFIRATGAMFPSRELRTVVPGVSGTMTFSVAGSCITHDTETNYWARNGFATGDTIHVSGSTSCDGEYTVSSISEYGTHAYDGTALILTIAPAANETTAGVHVASDTQLSGVLLPADCLRLLEVRVNGDILPQNAADIPDDTGTRDGWTLRGRTVFLDNQLDIDDEISMQIMAGWPVVDWSTWVAGDEMPFPDSYYSLALYYILKSCTQAGEYKNDTLYREYSLAYDRELKMASSPASVVRSEMSFGDSL